MREQSVGKTLRSNVSVEQPTRALGVNHLTGVVTSVAAQAQTVMRLQAPDGGPVCGTDGAVVSTGKTMHLLSQVGVVPPVKGPAVHQRRDIPHRHRSAHPTLSR